MVRAIAPDISNFPADEPQLIGGRCGDCNAIAFPKQVRCPHCSSKAITAELLPRRGTIAAWTTQGFHPGFGYKGTEDPKAWKPIGMGLVQLGDVIKVEGRLTESDPEKLHTGMEVELTFVPFYTDDDGEEVLTFAFQPV